MHNLSRKKKLIDDEKKSITTALLITQNAKYEIFARCAKYILNTNKTNKVVLFFDYDKPINNAYDLLIKYNPVIINGKVNKKLRPALISKFQEPNSESRLLIFNMSVGCEGISLDDTNGNFKRYVFGAPNYYIMRMHQMSRRFYRASTKSEPIIYYIYGICGMEETSIINSLAKKNNVMKETLLLQVDEGIVFPGDYPQLIEQSNDENELNLVSIESKHVEIAESKSIKIGKSINYKIESNMKGIKHTPNVKNEFFDI